MKNGNRLASTIYYAYLILSLLSMVYCLANYQNLMEPHPVYILPSAYALALFISIRLRTVFMSLPIFIINTVCLIRYAYYPFRVVLEGEYLFSDEAIYLMAYEVVTVILFLNIYINRLLNRRDGQQHSYQRFKLGTLNKLMIALIFPLGVMFPSLLSIFGLFFARGTVPASGLVTIMFRIGTMVAYVYLLSRLGNNKQRGQLFSLFISILIAVFYIFFTSVRTNSVSRWNFLWVGIPTTYLLVASYPKYKKRIISYSLMLIPLSIFIGSFVKFTISNVSLNKFISYFLNSESINAYFAGLNGVTEALTYLRGNDVIESTYGLLTDLFGNMPIVSRFFDTERYSTHAFYHEAINRTDQICPLLAQSVLHFGNIGAPILSVMMTMIALECDIASKSAVNVYTLFGLRMFCVIFSLFMCLNTMILLPNAWLLIIYLLIQYINNKMFLNGKAVNYRSSL